MKIEDFEALIDTCKITMNENGKVIFTPWRDKDEERISKIIADNGLEKISLNDFNEIVAKHRSLYMVRQKLKQQKAEQFSAMTTKQIAELPLEQKIEYMEILFPRRQTVNETMEVCKKNEENIKACLFNIDFPKSFWDKEKKQADRYASLIANQPEITDRMKNWQETSLDNKKDVIRQAANIFKYVYGTAPKIEFFTEEQEKARQKNAGLNENAHINAAYYHKGKIHFNEERLQKSDNFFAVSVMFHEGTHLRQDCENFDNPLVKRIFDCDMNNVTLYENEINDRESANYKDLYAMQPGETHAHGLQEYMEQQLTEKTGIEKDRNTNSKEVKRIHNKAFSMAKLTQYRSK
ncbi:MAG: hypothetical protein SO314_01085 [Alphaproteobacteria bacterium]|nr:hypothetical protein [Alphaproteobacteria bacterium]